jgi:hypothetical protein
MLRALHCPDSPLTALRGASLPPAPVTRDPVPNPELPVKRASFWWRAKQKLLLLRNGSYLIPLWAKLARKLNLFVGYGELHGRIIHKDGSVTELGLLGRNVITTAGVTYLAADMAGGANDINLFKYHGCGTGATSEAAGDTALVTELTTQYASDNTRPTGSQSSSTNVYTTVGTVTPDSGGTLAITEHGLFSQAATGGGTLWDRTVFSAVNVVGGSGDAIQFTYTSTFPGGS